MSRRPSHWVRQVFLARSGEFVAQAGSLCYEPARKSCHTLLCDGPGGFRLSAGAHAERPYERTITNARLATTPLHWRNTTWAMRRIARVDISG